MARRPRRVDIEEVLGRIETPSIEGGQYLIDVLFRVGPVAGETPLREHDLEGWERRRGIELSPWEADLVLDLSRFYLAEMHTAKSPGALPAWKPAIAAWKYVMDKMNNPTADE